MGFLSKIFGSSNDNCCIEQNQVLVNFTKLYYKFPDTSLKFEGKSKEYNNFDDFIIDFPLLNYWDLQKSKHIKIDIGYFFEYRGYLYLCNSIEECLNKKIGFYLNEKYSSPSDHLEISLIEKKHFTTLFSNSQCFLIELGTDLSVNMISLKHKGVISATTKSLGNMYSTISIGPDNKPIMFGDKILLINVDDYKFKKYLPNEYKELDVPIFPEIYYGYAINYERNCSTRCIFDSPEKLLRKKNVVVDFLKYEDIDIDNYLEGFIKQSRKRKLEKLMKINNKLKK